MQFYQLKIDSIKEETPDTKTFYLDVPETLTTVFKYQQGQYVTVKIAFDGQELRRAYSLCSSPIEPKLAFTVKKVEGGKVSTFLNEEISVGDVLEFAPPEGRFTLKMNPDRRGTYYFFAAGSGITPVFSILKTVLEEEPMSAVFLLYGSRNEESIIFKEELEKMTARYRGQLNVEHVLSQPQKSEGGGLFGLFKKSSSSWQGKKGRIDNHAVIAFLNAHFVQGPESESRYFICGPGDMTENIKYVLVGRGLPSKQIFTEYFVNAGQKTGSHASDSATSGGGDKKLLITLKGQKIEMTAKGGKTILENLLEEKYEPPYSCTAGACATCMAKILSGKVTMDACYALDDDEVKAGYCLTCQARPETDVVELSYDL